MKKILISFFIITLLTGCSFNTKNLTNETPKEVVEKYFSNYQTLSNDVLKQLDDVIEKEKLSTEAKSDYRDIMKKHYKDLNYEIKDEVIDGNKATVITEIEVYDYSKTLKEADSYLKDHKEEFNNEKGEYDIVKFNDYRVKKLKDVKDKTKYTLNLALTKTDDKWILDDISETDENKIHGTYIS